MLKETNSIAEYKTPKCKVVEVKIQRALMSTSVFNPFEGSDEENNEEEI